MPFKMRTRGRIYYLKAIELSFEDAKRKAVAIRRKTGACYKIINKGIFGGFEVWVDRRGFYD